MFTQLSLFDSAVSIDTLPSTTSFVPVSPAAGRSGQRAGEAAQSPQAQPPRRLSQAAAGERRSDELRPMGELAQLVLARYDLLAQRRQEMNRRRREQPQKSIRVLSPRPMLAR